MKRSSVKLNVLYQMLYELLALCLPLVTSPYISRILGAEQVGIYSYIHSIAVYFGMACILGGKNHGNRAIAKCRNDPDEISRTFSNIYSLQLIVSSLAVCVYVVFCFFQVGEYRIYFLIELIYVVSCLLDINWFFFGIEQFKLTVARNSVIKILNFIAIFVFVRTEADLWKYCIIMVGSAFLSQAVMWFYLPHYVYFVRPEPKEVVKHAKPMFILFIPVVAVSLYNVMDKIMVGSISTKTQLGYYENSEKIIDCVKTVITSFGTVMLPRMSRLAVEHDEKQTQRYMALSADAVMCAAFALAFGVAAVADLFAPVFWGDSFSACGPLLTGLAISLPFSAMANMIRSQYMIPNGMDNAYIIAVLLGACVNLGANLLLIPGYGAMGAVIATVLAEGLVCTVQCISVHGRIPIAVYLRKSLPYLFFGFIMFAAVKVLNTQSLIANEIVMLLLEICAGAAVYVVLSAVYLIATKNELIMGPLQKLSHAVRNHSS